MTTAALADWISAAPIAFLVGVLVGFVIASRYRIVKLNGKNGEGRP